MPSRFLKHVLNGPTGVPVSQELSNKLSKVLQMKKFKKK